MKYRIVPVAFTNTYHVFLREGKTVLFTGTSAQCLAFVRNMLKR